MTAAYSAARDAIAAQNLSAQVFADVDKAVEVAAAPAGNLSSGEVNPAPEPAPETEEVPAP